MIVTDVLFGISKVLLLEVIDVLLDVEEHFCVPLASSVFTVVSILLYYSFLLLETSQSRAFQKSPVSQQGFTFACLFKELNERTL